jgi:hypothetical protein
MAETLVELPQEAHGGPAACSCLQDPGAWSADLLGLDGRAAVQPERLWRGARSLSCLETTTALKTKEEGESGAPVEHGIGSVAAAGALTPTLKALSAGGAMASALAVPAGSPRSYFAIPAFAHCCPGKELRGACHELERFAYHLVIPAKAGTQVVPKLVTSHGVGMPAFLGLAVPALRLALWRGTAWVPAFAGMTK